MKSNSYTGGCHSFEILDIPIQLLFVGVDGGGGEGLVIGDPEQTTSDVTY